MDKPENTFRLLVLGDSFAEAATINDDETFCYLLEKRLNKEKKDSRDYEVLNAAAGSYVPLLEYLYLRREGIRFDPDMVVLFFDMSDLWQTEAYWDLAVSDEEGEIIAIPPPDRSFLRKLYKFGREHFYFTSTIIGHITQKLAPDFYKRLTVLTETKLDFTLSASQEPWDADWQRIYKDINRVSNLCKERGIKFVVVVYPWGHQVNDREWAKGRIISKVPVDYTAPADLSYMLEDRLKSEGIEVLNLFPILRKHKYEGDEMLYYVYDMHWTEYGHKVVAGHLFDFVSGLIEKEDL